MLQWRSPSTPPGSQTAFVERMNAEARRLGMIDTRFANPTGFSDAQQYSSPRDLARLALRLQADYPQFRPLFPGAGTHLQPHHAGKFQPIAVERPGGRRPEDRTAGSERLVDRRDRRPARGTADSAFERRLVAIVLGAPSDAVRTQEALRLLNYGYTAYDTVLAYRGGHVLARAEVWKGDSSEVPIGPERDVYITLPTDELQRLGERGLRSAINVPTRCSLRSPKAKPSAG